MKQKEKPILFSADMVRALLDGRKTQTRRIVKTWSHEGKFACPYGEVGDTLYVQESWGFGTRPDPREGWVDGIEYAADEEYCDEVETLPLSCCIPEEVDIDDWPDGWLDPATMPEWASRIKLVVKNVRVERLQDISGPEAVTEGVERVELPNGGWGYRNYMNQENVYWEPIGSFKSLINSVYGPETWNSNPWVWVVEFERDEK